MNISIIRNARNSKMEDFFMLKHFVEFCYPVSFVREYTCKEIAEREPKMVKLPAGAFGYRFYDQEHITNGDQLIMIGKERNYSGYTYFGKLYTLEQIKKDFPEKTSLILNMKINGWDKAVKICDEEWVILNEEDKVIED